MKSAGKFSDQRVKKKLFPFSTFVLFFFMFAVLTTLQMFMIGQAIDYKNLPAQNVIAVLAFWVVASVCSTLITGLIIRHHYQKPIEEFSEAARKVASGDFSVYLPPKHPMDKTTHLDVLFMDFNKMVEELGSIETLKTDFFSNVSHEIKTPLAVIQNNAELLQKKQLTEELRKIYPKTRCGDFTQALMELGAVVCLPNGEPKCGICPLHAKCGAFLAGTARENPLRTERKERKVEEKTILLLRHDGKLALNRRPDHGLLAGMMELPGLPGFRTKQEVLLVLNERNIPFRSMKEGIRANHIFSHVEWKMRAWEIECTAEVPGYEWVTAEELRSRISLPSAFQMFLKRKKR